MKPTLLAATILVLLFGVDPAHGVDLSKIDRTIRKEPAYQTKTPRYCLLVFGPQAKTKAWVIVDGDALYVDRNCNGDLTEEGERTAIKRNWELNLDQTKRGKWIQGDNVPVAITEPDGTVHHVSFRRASKGFGLGAKSLGGQYVGSTYRNDLEFADRPQDAPIVHLNGPLTLQLVDPPRIWAPGESVDLAVLFGTPGLGKNTFAYMIHSFASRPVADIQFPGKNPGDPAIAVKVALAGGSKPGFVGG
jgi:hypothetical protein